MARTRRASDLHTSPCQAAEVRIVGCLFGLGLAFHHPASKRVKLSSANWSRPSHPKGSPRSPITTETPVPGMSIDASSNLWKSHAAVPRPPVLGRLVKRKWWCSHTSTTFPSSQMQNSTAWTHCSKKSCCAMLVLGFFFLVWYAFSQNPSACLFCRALKIASTRQAPEPNRIPPENPASDGGFDRMPGGGIL